MPETSGTFEFRVSPPPDKAYQVNMFYHYKAAQPGGINSNFDDSNDEEHIWLKHAGELVVQLAAANFAAENMQNFKLARELRREVGVKLKELFHQTVGIEMDNLMATIGEANAP